MRYVYIGCAFSGSWNMCRQAVSCCQSNTSWRFCCVVACGDNMDRSNSKLVNVRYLHQNMSSNISTLMTICTVSVLLQALGLLYWHRYNLEKAIGDLPNFCPLQGRQKDPTSTLTHHVTITWWSCNHYSRWSPVTRTCTGHLIITWWSCDTPR